MKRSAGILPYKYIDNELYVYLEHPGGPFWEGIDKWSVVKGEYNNEKPDCAARREFYEEAGFEIKEDLEYMGTFKLKNKLVIMYMIEKDLDASKMKSGFFKREFNGKIDEYSEMDAARWFKIDEAYLYIFDRQVSILNRINILKNKER